MMSMIFTLMIDNLCSWKTVSVTDRLKVNTLITFMIIVMITRTTVVYFLAHGPQTQATTIAYQYEYDCGLSLSLCLCSNCRNEKILKFETVDSYWLVV